jgi:hypothetical protein
MVRLSIRVSSRRAICMAVAAIAFLGASNTLAAQDHRTICVRDCNEVMDHCMKQIGPPPNPNALVIPPEAVHCRRANVACIDRCNQRWDVR